MKLFHVVAMAKNRVIGKNNELPWHFPADLKHFKELTSGHAVIMGRKTYESIFDRIKKPLPNRENIVLSRSSQTSEFDNLHYFTSIDEAIENVNSDQAFIIGGSTIYEQTLEKVDGIYLTLIDQDYEGDAFYPEIPEQFVEKDRKVLQENPTLSICYFERSTNE